MDAVICSRSALCFTNWPLGNDLSAEEIEC